MIMQSWLFDPLVSGGVATLVALPAAALSVEAARWSSRFPARVKERQVVSRLVAEYYDERPKRQLLELAPDLALGRRYLCRRTRLLKRAERASALREERYDRFSDGAVYARRWINTVGRAAYEAGAIEEIALRRFLQTYHLGVLREGTVATPFVLCLLARGELSQGDVEYALWGMALVDLAARYNSIARQQRQSVFIDVKGVERPLGPIVRPPARWRRPWLSLVDMCSPELVLRARHRRAVHRRTRALMRRWGSPLAL